MIRFLQVTKRYSGGMEALSSLSFSVSGGEMVFVTGHSGAGKSTLLRLATAEEYSTRGQVLVGGHNTAALSRTQFAYFRRHIGTVFQDHRLLTDRTVFDNISLPLVVAGYSYQEIQRRVRAALKQVGLSGKDRMSSIMLSAGEQQRVGIARAVVNRPPLLIADEPTGNLDPALSLEIMGLFQRFNQLGTTVLIATHDIDLIRRLRHRILVLEDGELIAEGYGDQ